MFVTQLARQTIDAAPVQDLVSILEKKVQRSCEHGHTWCTFDVAGDGMLHAKEALKIKAAFEGAARKCGFKVESMSDEASWTYKIAWGIDRLEAVGIPGDLQQQLALLKEKCQSEAKNGHAWCHYDLEVDGMLHPVEASKIQEMFAHVASLDGLSVGGPVAGTEFSYRVDWGAECKKRGLEKDRFGRLSGTTLRTQLALQTVDAPPVHVLVDLLQKKVQTACEHGHTWCTFDIADEGMLHKKEASKIKVPFQSAARRCGLVVESIGDEASGIFKISWCVSKVGQSGAVKQQLALLKEKCESEAKNGHAWCYYDLEVDGMLHPVEASKMQEVIVQVATTEGLSVGGPVTGTQFAYRLDWGAACKKEQDRPRKIRKVQSGGA